VFHGSCSNGYIWNGLFFKWKMGVMGQSRRRWMDEVVELMGLRLQQPKEAARDRVEWRNVVRVVTRGRLRPDGTR